VNKLEPTERFMFAYQNEEGNHYHQITGSNQWAKDTMMIILNEDKELLNLFIAEINTQLLSTLFEENHKYKN
jgi:hypothetical protein